MDLASECSASKSSVVPNDTYITPEDHFEDIHNTSNGNDDKIGYSSIAEVDYLSCDESKSNQSDKAVEQDIGFGQMLNLPSTKGKLKGNGLRKWRRYRRNFVSDSRSNVDSSQKLKRGLSNSENAMKPSYLSAEGEGFVGSASIQSKNWENGEYLLHGSSSASRLTVGSVFAAGNVSDNSEDRSNKSSTAASAPKIRYQKSEINNFGGKGLGYSSQRTQKEKFSNKTTKKQRGERVKTEENSRSSIESDSRSSNIVFMQGDFSAIGNGKQSGKVTSYDEENSDEAQASEQHFNEDLQTGYNVENADKFNDLSEDDLATGSFSWKAKQERNDNHIPSAGDDPLVKSVLTLKSVQEALERELRKFVVIGKENSFASFERGENDASHSDNIEQSASTGSLEIRLTHKVKSLEGKLEEVTAILKAKESRVSELEATHYHHGNSQKKEEIETELESLLLRKIQAEVEYAATVKKIKNLKTVSKGQNAPVEEQKSLVGDKKQMLNKFEEAGSKAEMLKKQAQVLKMKNRVFKISACFSIQLVLLVVFFWLLVLRQFSPQSGEDVPT